MRLFFGTLDSLQMGQASQVAFPLQDRIVVTDNSYTRENLSK